MSTPTKVQGSPGVSSVDTPGEVIRKSSDGEDAINESSIGRRQETVTERSEGALRNSASEGSTWGARFDVGKGDAVGSPESIGSGICIHMHNRSIAEMLVDFYCEGIPWTRRQLILLLTEKLRTRSSSLVETFLLEMNSVDLEKLDQLRAAAFTLIDLAVEDFLKAVIQVPNKTKTVSKAVARNVDRYQWIQRSRRADKKATTDLCEAEIRTELLR